MSNRGSQVREWIQIGTAVILFIGGVFSLYYDSQWGVANSIVSKFVEGDVSSSEARDKAAFIPRDLSELVSCLRPSEVTTYVAIVGESGTGKSTAVRKAIRALDHPFAEEKTHSSKGEKNVPEHKTTEGVTVEDEGSTQTATAVSDLVKRRVKGGGRGVVYVEASDTISGFMRALTAKIRFRHTYNILGRVRMVMYGDPITERPVTKDPLIDEWDAVKDALVGASKLYKAKYGRPAVLVIDAVDLIAKKDPQFFRDIQAFAKQCADDGYLRFIFVFSDSVALPALLDAGNSAQSRVTELIEVGDISDAEAIRYLRQKHKMPEERANEMVTTITGGRFSLLNKYGESKTPLTKLRDVLNTRTNKALELADVPSTSSPFFKQLLASPNHQLKDENIKRWGITREHIQKLLFRNVIAFHPDETLTFNNRHVELFIRSEVEKAKKEEEEKRKQEEEERSSWWHRWWIPSPGYNIRWWEN